MKNVIEFHAQTQQLTDKGAYHLAEMLHSVQNVTLVSDWLTKKAQTAFFNKSNFLRRLEIKGDKDYLWTADKKKDIERKKMHSRILYAITSGDEEGSGVECE